MLSPYLPPSLSTLSTVPLSTLIYPLSTEKADDGTWVWKSE
jgi:hypothetical protein